MTAIFFTGDGLEFYAGSSIGPDVSSSIDVTAPGFQPTAVLLTMSGQPIGSSWGSWSYPGIGVAVDKATDEHGTFFGKRPDAKPDSNDWSMSLFDDFTYGEVRFDGDTINYAFSVDGWDSRGFSLTHSSGSTNANEEVFYLAMDTGDRDVTVQFIDTPTSTGVASFTGFGFKPQAIIIGQTRITTVDTISGATVGASEIGVGFGSVNNENSYSWTDKANVGDMVAKTKAESEVANLCDEDGASLFAVTIDSFTSDGVDLNFTATDTGAARKWFIFAIEETDVALPILLDFRKRRFNALLVR